MNGDALAHIQPVPGLPYHPRVLRDPADVDELQPLLRAMKRGTRRSRLRQLEVVCREHGRLLAEVYPTGAGPVLLGRGRLINDGDGDGAVVLADVDAYAKAANLRDPDAVQIRVQCGRCTQGLLMSWLRRGLAGDRPRLVYL